MGEQRERWEQIDPRSEIRDQPEIKDPQIRDQKSEIGDQYGAIVGKSVFWQHRYLST